VKIFYFVDTFNVGGTESQMTGVVLRLAKRHDITVGCLKAEGRFLELLQQENIPVMEFDTGRGLLSMKGLQQLFRLTYVLAKGKFDVIHSQDPWTNLLGVPAGRLAFVPVVVTSRLDLANWGWYTSKKRVIMRWVQKASTAIFANSLAVRDSLVKIDRFKPEKVRVILNGVDCEHFTSAKPERAKALPQCDAESRLIAMVANMHFELKGHSFLIRAAEKIIAKFPSTTFVLIGDGERRGLLEQQVCQLGLQDKFAFLGPRRDIAEILACCYIGILPSLSEGMPNVVLEYMAAGLPVVASKVGGIPEIIQDKVHGLLIPPADSDAIADAIIYLCSNPREAEAIARRGQERARTRFSFEQLVSELELLYEGKPEPVRKPDTSHETAQVQ
jgi:L-malate glycosyltransferase